MNDMIMKQISLNNAAFKLYVSEILTLNGEFTQELKTFKLTE